MRPSEREVVYGTVADMYISSIHASHLTLVHLHAKNKQTIIKSKNVGSSIKRLFCAYSQVENKVSNLSARKI